MAQNSKIEWTDATWNPIVGCTIATPGCTNCYAMKDAWRMGANPKTPQYHGTTKLVNGKPVWTGKLHFVQSALTVPLRRKKPTTYFVNSMGDLFHENVPDEWIDQVFAVMELCPQHIFQVLTKRAERMQNYLTLYRGRKIAEAFYGLGSGIISPVWPLSNIWLGVSVEDQKRADERIPYLLDTPAAVRFISAEPLLGPVDLTLDGLIFEDCPDDCEYAHIEPDTNAFVCRRCEDNQKTDDVGIDWLICGGESGPKARPLHPDWARSLRDQCADAGVPFFFKQWGAWIDADEWFRIIQAGPGNLLCSGTPWKPSTPKNFEDGQALAGIGGFKFKAQSDGCTMLRVGKTRAGCLLDGVEHNGVPEVE